MLTPTPSPHDTDPTAPLDTAGLGPSTAAVHAGEGRHKPGHSITDPIFAASTYTFADTQAIVDFIDEQTRAA